MTGLDELDELVAAAGQTHVIPPREDPVLLKRLRDPRVLERARAHLGSRDETWRTRAILCLERIGYVVHDQETAELLLAHAAAAKSKYEVMTTLTALHKCTPPRPLPSAPLVALTRRQEWQVWHEAVRCLHLAPAAEVEEALLERLDADRYGLSYVAFELRYLTSERSLRALESLLAHESVEVRCAALGSLATRLGAGVLPFARRVSESRQIEEKLLAEDWLSRYGTAEDMRFMAARAKRLLGAKRARRYYPPELASLVPFLRRFAGEPEADAALAALDAGRSRLPDEEREWLEANALDPAAELASSPTTS